MSKIQEKPMPLKHLSQPMSPRSSRKRLDITAGTQQEHTQELLINTQRGLLSEEIILRIENQTIDNKLFDQDNFHCSKMEIQRQVDQNKCRRCASQPLRNNMERSGANNQRQSQSHENEFADQPTFSNLQAFSQPQIDPSGIGLQKALREVTKLSNPSSKNQAQKKATLCKKQQMQSDDDNKNINIIDHFEDVPLFKNSSNLHEQVLTSELVQTSVKTPIDDSRFIQALWSDLLQAVIVVQVITRNTVDSKSNYNNDQQDDGPDWANYQEIDKSHKKNMSCSICKVRNVQLFGPRGSSDTESQCYKCMVQPYTDQKVLQKTANHKIYQEKCLKEVEQRFQLLTALDDERLYIDSQEIAIISIWKQKQSETKVQFECKLQYQLTSPYLKEFETQSDSLNSASLGQHLPTLELLFKGQRDRIQLSNEQSVTDTFYFFTNVVDGSNRQSFALNQLDLDQIKNDLASQQKGNRLPFKNRDCQSILMQEIRDLEFWPAIFGESVKIQKGNGDVIIYKFNNSEVVKTFKKESNCVFLKYQELPQMQIWSLKLEMRKPMIICEQINSKKLGQQYQINSGSDQLVSLLKNDGQSNQPMQVKSFKENEGKIIFILCFQQKIDLVSEYTLVRIEVNQTDATYTVQKTKESGFMLASQNNFVKSACDLEFVKLPQNQNLLKRFKTITGRYFNLSSFVTSGTNFEEEIIQFSVGNHVRVDQNKKPIDLNIVPIKVRSTMKHNRQTTFQFPQGVVNFDSVNNENRKSIGHSNTVVQTSKVKQLLQSNQLKMSKSSNSESTVIALFYRGRNNQYHLEFSDARSVVDKTHDFGQLNPQTSQARAHLVVNYPLLAYLSPHPMCNRLQIVNLARNDCQTSINLDHFKVDFFFEKGTHSPLVFEDLSQKTIFFMAKKGDHYSILCYQQEAWRYKPGKVQELHGMIELPQEVTLDNVKQAILFQDSFTPQQAKFVKSVLNYLGRSVKKQDQMSEKRNQSFLSTMQSVSKPIIDYTALLLNDKQSQLLVIDHLAKRQDTEEAKDAGQILQFDKLISIMPIQMVFGHQKDTFYVSHNKPREKYEIKRIKRDDHSTELEHTVIYESEWQILMISENLMKPTDINPSVSQFSLLVLDIDENLIVLNEQTGLWKKTVKKLPSSIWLSNLISNIKLSQFPEIILEKNTVSAYSYLFGCGTDSKIKVYLFDSTLLLSNSFDRTTKPQDVSKLMQISNIGKEFQEIRNNNQRFFLTQTKAHMRQLDLMDSVSARVFIRQIKMTNNRIFVFVDHSRSLNFINEEQFCIEFDRKTLIVTDVHNDACKITVSQDQQGQGHSQFIMLKDKTSTKVKILGEKCSSDICGAKLQIYNKFDLKKLQDHVIQQHKKDHEIYSQHQNLFFSQILTQDGCLTFICVEQHRENDQSDYKESTDLKPFFKLEESPICFNQQNEKVKIYHLSGKLLDIEPEQTFLKNKNDFQILIIGKFIVFRVYENIHFFSYESTLNTQVNKQVDQDIVQSVPCNQFTFFKESKEFIHLSSVPKKSYEFFAKDDKDDLLQISLENKLLVWDLNTNQQVHVIENYQEFLAPMNFVDTGFALMMIGSKRNKKGKKEILKKRMMTNQAHTAYCLAYDSINQKVGYYFKPYSQLELREILHLKALESSGETHNHTISKDALTSEVYGVTCFETFFDSIKVILKSLKELRQTIAKDSTYSRQISVLLTNPTTGDFSILTKEERRNFANQASMNPNFKRNIIMRAIRFLIISERQARIEEVNGFVEQSFEILSSQNKPNLNDVICCVHEYWHLQVEMSEIQCVGVFLAKSLAASELTFNGQNIDVQWCDDLDVIYFGGSSNLFREEIIRKMIKDNQKKLATKLSEWSDLALNKNQNGNKTMFTRLIRRISKIKYFQQKFTMQTVSIRSYNIEWLQQNQRTLFHCLAEHNDLEIYSNTFINDFICCQKLTGQLFVKAMVPYLIETIMILWIYIDKLGTPFSQRDNDELPFYIIILICMVWLLYLEFRQFIQNPIQYMTDGWNQLMIISVILVIATVVADVRESENVSVVVFASLSGFMQVIQLFYWSQMFKKLSMYSSIVIESMVESGYFMIMLAVTIAAFTMGVYIIDQIQQKMFDAEVHPVYSDKYAEYAELTEDRMYHETLDSLFVQYTMMLGNHQIIGRQQVLDTYPQANEIMIYLYFVVGAFMLQVVFINVMVAVLGEAYGEKWAKKDLYANQSIAQIFGDYIDHLTTTLPQDKYLYVVRPRTNQDSVETRLQEMTDRQALFEKRTDSKLDKISQQLSELLQANKQ